MKRLFVLFCLMFALVSSGCVKAPFVGVESKIKNMYDSSVSILDDDAKPIGAGTIIYNKKGNYMVVLTAAHVVDHMAKNNARVYISYMEDSVREMIIYKYNKRVDLAVLVSTTKEREDGPYVKLSEIAGKIGQKVWAIGAPLSEERTVTSGIISNRVFVKKTFLYRVDISAFFGNSGGGLFTEDGKLIGVMNSINLVRVNPFCILVEPGASFAVPLETILSFI